MVALLALPAAMAADPTLVLVDDTEGWFAAPTTPFVGSPLAHEFQFDVPECYRRLAIDLRYEPDALIADVEGAGEAEVSYEFRVEVWRNGSLVLEERVARSGYNSLLGLLPEPGEHTMRLSLGWGADVNYTMRLRGLFLSESEACNPPILDV